MMGLDFTTRLTLLQKFLQRRDPRFGVFTQPLSAALAFSTISRFWKASGSYRIQAPRTPVGER